MTQNLIIRMNEDYGYSFEKKIENDVPATLTTKNAANS